MSTISQPVPSPPHGGRARTGPKTAAGKAKVARNALRHGLAAAAVYDPQAMAEVRALAQAIAGPGAAPELVHVAQAIAQAQVDLQRVRTVREGIWARVDWIGTNLEMRSLTFFTWVIGELTALERYERRARSRRKFAIRAFARLRGDLQRWGATS